MEKSYCLYPSDGICATANTSLMYNLVSVGILVEFTKILPLVLFLFNKVVFMSLSYGKFTVPHIKDKCSFSQMMTKFYSAVINEQQHE